MTVGECGQVSCRSCVGQGGRFARCNPGLEAGAQRPCVLFGRRADVCAQPGCNVTHALVLDRQHILQEPDGLSGSCWRPSNSSLTVSVPCSVWAKVNRGNPVVLFCGLFLVTIPFYMSIWWLKVCVQYSYAFLTECEYQLFQTVSQVLNPPPPKECYTNIAPSPLLEALFISGCRAARMFDVFFGVIQVYFKTHMWLW